MRGRHHGFLLVTALAGCLAAGADAQTSGAGAAAATPSFDRTTPVTARVVAEGKEKVITFIGRKDRTLYFTIGSGGAGQIHTLKLEQIDEVVFDLGLDSAAVFDALRKRDWDTAVRELLPAVKPALPYLDLPENNAVERALELGDTIMRSAEKKRRTADSEEEQTTVRKKYEAAYTVLSYASKAFWTSDGTLAALKAVQCLLELDKPRTARRHIEDIEEPMVGDAAYGLYWLTRADIEFGRRRFRSAMEGAVKSLCFETKDVDTFPDALLLSARCYEELQQWHRARDVYYEVARIFPRTDWADAAVDRLAFIMDRGLTSEPEETPIENVFFAFQEDMNKAATELLEKLKHDTEEDDTMEDEEIDEDPDADPDTDDETDIEE